MSPRKRLRSLLDREEIGLLAGAHDALSARLVEEAGFDGVWASSFGLSLASRCVPDVDLVGQAESLEITANMIRAVAVPVVADCNTGFGNAINVIHMTRDYESAGVAGICIEDNCFPKRCSLYDRKRRELVSKAEMVGKIAAAKHAQRDPDLVVIARVEALIAGHGVDAALERGTAYAAAGADAVVIHAKSWPLLAEVVARWPGSCPLVAIPTLYGHVSTTELQRAGFALAIFPNQAVRAAVRAMRSALRTIRGTGLGNSVEAEIAPLAEIYELVDLLGLEAAERRFLQAEESEPERTLQAGIENLSS